MAGRESGPDVFPGLRGYGWILFRICALGAFLFDISVLFLYDIIFIGDFSEGAPVLLKYQFFPGRAL